MIFIRTLLTRELNLKYYLKHNDPICSSFLLYYLSSIIIILCIICLSNSCHASIKITNDIDPHNYFGLQVINSLDKPLIITTNGIDHEYNVLFCRLFHSTTSNHEDMSGLYEISKTYNDLCIPTTGHIDTSDVLEIPIILPSNIVMNLNGSYTICAPIPKGTYTVEQYLALLAKIGVFSAADSTDSSEIKIHWRNPTSHQFTKHFEGYAYHYTIASSKSYVVWSFFQPNATSSKNIAKILNVDIDEYEDVTSYTTAYNTPDDFNHNNTSYSVLIQVKDMRLNRPLADTIKTYLQFNRASLKSTEFSNNGLLLKISSSIVEGSHLKPTLLLKENNYFYARPIELNVHNNVTQVWQLSTHLSRGTIIFDPDSTSKKVLLEEEIKTMINYAMLPSNLNVRGEFNIDVSFDNQHDYDVHIQYPTVATLGKNELRLVNDWDGVIYDDINVLESDSIYKNINICNLKPATGVYQLPKGEQSVTDVPIKFYYKMNSIYLDKNRPYIIPYNSIVREHYVIPPLSKRSGFETPTNVFEQSIELNRGADEVTITKYCDYIMEQVHLKVVYDIPHHDYSVVSQLDVELDTSPMSSLNYTGTVSPGHDLVYIKKYKEQYFISLSEQDSKLWLLQGADDDGRISLSDLGSQISLRVRKRSFEPVISLLGEYSYPNVLFEVSYPNGSKTVNLAPGTQNRVASIPWLAIPGHDDRIVISAEKPQGYDLILSSWTETDCDPENPYIEWSSDSPSTGMNLQYQLKPLSNRHIVLLDMTSVAVDRRDVRKALDSLLERENDQVFLTYSSGNSFYSADNLSEYEYIRGYLATASESSGIIYDSLKETMQSFYASSLSNTRRPPFIHLVLSSQNVEYVTYDPGELVFELTNLGLATSNVRIYATSNKYDLGILEDYNISYSDLIDFCRP